MKRQLTRLLTALLAVILLLPVTAQAAPAWDGWTAELEAAYQTVSGLVADSVSESRDYLSCRSTGDLYFRNWRFVPSDAVRPFHANVLSKLHR